VQVTEAAGVAVQTGAGPELGPCAMIVLPAPGANVTETGAIVAGAAVPKHVAASQMLSSYQRVVPATTTSDAGTTFTLSALVTGAMALLSPYGTAATPLSASSMMKFAVVTSARAGLLSNREPRVAKTAKAARIANKNTIFFPPTV